MCECVCIYNCDFYGLITFFLGVNVHPCLTGRSVSRLNTRFLETVTPGSLLSGLASRATSRWSSSQRQKTACCSTTAPSASPSPETKKTSSHLVHYTNSIRLQCARPPQCLFVFQPLIKSPKKQRGVISIMKTPHSIDTVMI